MDVQLSHGKIEFDEHHQPIYKPWPDTPPKVIVLTEPLALPEDEPEELELADLPEWALKLNKRMDNLEETNRLLRQRIAELEKEHHLNNLPQGFNRKAKDELKNRAAYGGYKAEQDAQRRSRDEVFKKFNR